AAPAPAEFGVVTAGEGVEQCVEIGRDRQTEMREIVAGIGDDREGIWRQDAVEAERQLGAADPTGQREYRTVSCTHRNRSEGPPASRWHAGGTPAVRMMPTSPSRRSATG